MRRQFFASLIVASGLIGAAYAQTGKSEADALGEALGLCSQHFEKVDAGAAPLQVSATATGWKDVSKPPAIGYEKSGAWGTAQVWMANRKGAEICTLGVKVSPTNAPREADLAYAAITGFVEKKLPNQQKMKSRVAVEGLKTTALETYYVSDRETVRIGEFPAQTDRPALVVLWRRPE